MTESGPRVPTEPFEIRRRGWLLVLVLLVAWGLAGAYAWAARDRDEPYLFAVAGALGLLGLVFVARMRHLRTPLLVADLHGVRLQHRRGWDGYLWREMGDISVQPRRGLRGPSLRVRGVEDDVAHVVPLGLATDESPARAEVELARRREAASY